MSKTVAQAITSLLLVATCTTVVLVQPGLAQQLLPPQVPSLFPPGSPRDIVQCWSSIMNVQGCVWEISRSLFSSQFGNIGPACCLAILSIQENCWPKMFPAFPLFPPSLKGSCAPVAATAFAPSVEV